MRRITAVVGAAAMLVAFAGVAQAEFDPKFEVKLTDTKVKGNPGFDIHLEFSEEDEEIGNFTMTIPKGFNVAPDSAIEDDDVIGGGTIAIAAGPACRPDMRAIPIKHVVTVDATIYERDRTDAEADEGVHSVWFLDLEPLNRVRLLVTGSKATGWSVSGAPTPSDNTCNPLTVDLTINGKSDAGVALVTNPKKPGKKLFTADIASQDSAAVAHFEQIVRITR